MAVNAEEILAGSSFPSSQRWSRRKLLYLENRDWLIILEKEPKFLNTYIFLLTVLRIAWAENAGNTDGCHGAILHLSLIIHWVYFNSIVKRTIPTSSLDWITTINAWSHFSYPKSQCIQVIMFRQSMWVVLMIHNGTKSPFSSTWNDKILSIHSIVKPTGSWQSLDT